MSDKVGTQENVEQTRVLVPGDMVGGRFEIVRPLAEGGMGRVYVALQRPIDRQVALKVLRRELVSDTDSVKRFMREAVAASRLHHPNTITIIDYGEDEGPIHYIAMEFLDGQSLHQLLDREGRLSVERAISIVQQIARSLAEAHNKGVIHRDLKPENIFISHVESGRDLVKVLDFGIARVQEGSGATRITRAGYVCGTPEYMSPEQARGEELDGRSDLYSLGVMFWELLEGHPPYDAPTPLGIVLKHQNEEVPPLDEDVPEPVRRFIRRVMAKDRDDRPDNAEIFLQELEAIWSPLRGALGELGSSQTRVRLTPPHQTPSPVRATQEAELVSADTMDQMKAVTAVTPARRGLATVGLLVGGALLLLLLGGAALFAMQKEEPASASPPVPKAPVAASQLVIQSEPAGAQVTRDGQVVGATPLSLEGKPGSSASLEIAQEGFETLETRVTFPESGQLPMQYTLQEKATPAQIEVSLHTEPAGARLLRNGEPVGSTPMTLSLDPGEAVFTAQLHLEGFEPQDVRIDPARGTQTLSLQLKPAAQDAPAAAGDKRKLPHLAQRGRGKAAGDAAPVTQEKQAAAAPPVDKPRVEPSKKNKPGKSPYDLVD